MAAGLTVAELVDRGDLDDLLRRVDDLASAGDWAGVLELRDRSRAAFERGRQLWPAASHAEYRLALQAPGRWAAAVIGPGAGRFALGPLTEVAASTHTWDELAPHLPLGLPEGALIAEERVIRGEDLRGDGRIDPMLVELPLSLQPWEPAYPLAAYQPYTAEFDDVPAPAMEVVDVAAVAGGAGAGAAVVGAAVVEDHDATHALMEVVGPWTTQSNGRAAAVAVEGDALAAVGALPGVGGQARGSVRMAEVDAAQALAVLAWAGASGGAHGRRRGMAQGRFSAWWTAAALAGDLDGWPRVDIGGLRWYRWDRLEPSTGWVLRLAAERPSDGRAWAVEATDAR